MSFYRVKDHPDWWLDDEVIEIRKKDFEHTKNVAFSLGVLAGVLGLSAVLFVWLWTIGVF